MSSRFVSGGTIAGDGVSSDAREQQQHISTEQRRQVPPAEAALVDAERTRKQTEWEAVQRELDADRRRREDARRAEVEGDGEKSLYAILQENKAAKQAAFEEANKIRNQFRALDDDEIDFLDEVRADKKSEEARIRRETQEGLASFRKAQMRSAGGEQGNDGDDDTTTTEKQRGDTGDDGGVDEDEVSWAAAGRKRKREKDAAAKGIKGLKKRTTSSSLDAAEKKVPEKSDGNDQEETGGDKVPKAVSPPEAPTPKAKEQTAGGATTAPAASKPKLGLVDYGSDEDDDDDD